MSTSFLMFKGTVISLGSIFKLFTNIVLYASAGVTIGSLLIYSIGYFLGKPFLEHWGKSLGFSWEGIEKAQDKFANRQFRCTLY